MNIRSLTSSCLAACLLVMTFASATFAQDQRVVERISSAQMKSLVEMEGFPNVEIDGDDDLIVRMQGYRIIIFVRGNNYQQIKYRFAVGGTKFTLRDVNEWNRSMTFSKAYLDNDGDPVLEMDVDLEGGVTLARIKDSIRTFNTSLAAFLREVAL